MSTDADPSPAAPDDPLPSVEEFGEWLREDPANMDLWMGILEKLERGESGPMPAELVPSFRTALACHRAHRIIGECHAVMHVIKSGGLTPDTVRECAEQVAACEARLEAATDGLLDASEPARTRQITRIVGLRDSFREFRRSLEDLL